MNVVSNHRCKEKLFIIRDGKSEVVGSLDGLRQGCRSRPGVARAARGDEDACMRPQPRNSLNRKVLNALSSRRAL